MEHKSFIHSTEEWASILWMCTIKSTAKRNYSLLKNINTKIEASPTNKNNNKSVPSDEQRDDDRKTGKTYVWCRWNRPRPSPYVVICAHPHNFRHVYRILVWCLVCMFEQPRIAVKTVSHKIAINWIHIKAAVQWRGGESAESSIVRHQNIRVEFRRMSETTENLSTFKLSLSTLSTTYIFLLARRLSPIPVS